MFPLVRELADDGIDVAVTCRVLNVSRSGYYEWRTGMKSARTQENELLLTLTLAASLMMTTMPVAVAVAAVAVRVPEPLIDSHDG